MDAMILNLQMRMEILNRQLKTLEKIKSINKQKKNEHAQA
jgi:DNA-binding HxlR family transcriptional regulator